MIKDNELMIGDWVLTLDATHKEKVFAQVDAIEEGKRSILVTRECSNWFVDIDWIEPIPLTTEILEKNGFVIKKKWAQKGNFGNNPLIMWHYDDDITTRDFKHELEIHQNDTGKVHVSVQCDYVHELQHAMKLCGIKVEIEI